MKKLLLVALALASGALVSTAADKPRKLVLIAGKPSHPPGMHEFRAGSLLLDRKSTRLNSSHVSESRMPSSA